VAPVPLDGGSSELPAGVYVGGECPVNYYCPAGAAFPIACPANTVSGKGSVDVYDCKVHARTRARTHTHSTHSRTYRQNTESCQ
jgi:hypothetical protein